MNMYLDQRPRWPSAGCERQQSLNDYEYESCLQNLEHYISQLGLRKMLFAVFHKIVQVHFQVLKYHVRVSFSRITSISLTIQKMRFWKWAAGSKNLSNIQNPLTSHRGSPSHSRVWQVLAILVLWGFGIRIRRSLLLLSLSNAVLSTLAYTYCEQTQVPQSIKGGKSKLSNASLSTLSKLSNASLST